VLGSLVGLGLSLIPNSEPWSSSGWRLALGLGAAIVPLALFMRGHLPETFHAAQAANAERVSLLPHLRQIVCGLVMIASSTIAAYVFVYMGTYARMTLRLPESTAFTAALLSNISQTCAILVGGVLCDRIGRRPLMLWAHAALVLSSLPCFWWVAAGGGVPALYFTNIYLAGISSCCFGAIYATIAESLPPQIRARVFALVYSIPVAVFGGTTQLQLTWLIKVTGKPVAPGWYLTGTALFGLIAALNTRETGPRVQAGFPADPLPTSR
jgi:MFS family permease